MLVFEALLLSFLITLSYMLMCPLMRTRYQQGHCEMNIEETSIWPLESMQKILKEPGKPESLSCCLSLHIPWGQKQTLLWLITGC